MRNMAVLGAGNSAMKLIEVLPDLQDFDVFTSSGEGEFRGQKIHPISAMKNHHYDIIYIAIWKYKEVLPLLQFVDLSVTSIFRFDAIEMKLHELIDPFNDGQARFDSGDTLTTIYDMRFSPPTFDFLQFLLNCDIEREARGLANIEVIFAPGDQSGFRGNISFYNVDHMYQRLYKILLPLTNQLSCKVFPHICNSRAEARLHWEHSKVRYPENHDFHKPVVPYQMKDIFPKIHAGSEFQRLKPADDFYIGRVKAWLESEEIPVNKLVTISMREASYQEGRNKGKEKWIDLANKLELIGYSVVFIRDTEKSFENDSAFSQFRTFDTASIDLDIRRAIYDIAYINFFMNNGVATLGLFDPRVRLIQDGLLIPEYYPGYGEAQGYDVGNQHCFLKPWQQVIWEHYTAEELFEEFKKMSNVIDNLSPNSNGSLTYSKPPTGSSVTNIV